MRKILVSASILLLSLAPAGRSADKKPLKEVPGELREQLVQYLKSHWQSPEEYVVGKFFLGGLLLGALMNKMTPAPAARPAVHVTAA